MKKKYLLFTTLLFVFSLMFITPAMACHFCDDVAVTADCDGFTISGSVRANWAFHDGFEVSYNLAVYDGFVTIPVTGVATFSDGGISEDHVCIPFTINGAWGQEFCGDVSITGSVHAENLPQRKDSDDATLNTVVLNCPCGCTLTQGYWKRHSIYDNQKKYDATWALILPSDADTPFFLSGQSYYQVLNTSPEGNAYYILAKQYIAAELNQLAGASSTIAVDSAFSTAAALFAAYTPAQVGELEGDARNAWTDLSGILEDYNEGDIGPGHCED